MRRLITLQMLWLMGVVAAIRQRRRVKASVMITIQPRGVFVNKCTVTNVTPHAAASTVTVRRVVDGGASLKEIRGDTLIFG